MTAMTGIVSWRHASLAFRAGLALTILLVLVAALSFLWTPHTIDGVAVSNALKPPSASYWLGTDHFGRDVVSLLMTGARTSILVALLAVLIGIGIGVALGLLAAARGGWVDEGIMRGSDITFAFPAILTAVLLTALLGAGTINAILAIGIFNVPVFARATRGAAKAIWAREYVRAAEAVGKGRFRITIDHVLPNILGLLVVQATIQFAVAILAEAALSYLGIGAQPPQPSWGRMLRDAQTYIFIAPSLAVYPGLAIMLAVLGLNLLGDGLRDALDPRLRAPRG
jgi:peptide/nickel transport system permease protein